jgi:hypothetical protein
MSVTIERLDEMGCLLDDRDKYLAELFDYARERAARERCLKLMPKLARLCLHGSFGESAYKAVADESIGFAEASGATPTDAYLALAAALEKR